MHSYQSKRGTILLITMLFAGAIAIFLGSYLTISLYTLQMSNRSFFSNAAVDLVDAGIDQAMWNINDNSDTWTTAAAGSWTKTTPAGFTQYTRSIPYTLSNGASAKVNVWVNEPADGSNYQIVAKATVNFSTGSTNTSSSGPTGQIIKEAELYTSPPAFNKIPPSLFANGLVAKGPITLSGHTSLDSWDSSLNDAPAGQTPLVAPVPYYESDGLCEQQHLRRRQRQCLRLRFDGRCTPPRRQQQHTRRQFHRRQQPWPFHRLESRRRSSERLL
jgi:hypothetical protein